MVLTVLIVVEIVEKFFTIYGTWWFFALFQRHVNPIYILTHHFLNIHFIITFPSRLRLDLPRCRFPYVV
jgi:hypothetical protein